jgi:hypothetical protein
MSGGNPTSVVNVVGEVIPGIPRSFRKTIFRFSEDDEPRVATSGRSLFKSAHLSDADMAVWHACHEYKKKLFPIMKETPACGGNDGVCCNEQLTKQANPEPPVNAVPPWEDKNLNAATDAIVEARNPSVATGEGNALLDYASARRDARITDVKFFRRELDFLVNRMAVVLTPTTEETREAVKKVKEGVMWLGLELKRIGEANPYPDSKNPANTVINPTADGLKFGSR